MENKHDIGRDRQRVAAGQDWEVEYMAKKYNVSEKEVEDAIQRVGVSREKVEEFLSQKR
ncbi:MAG: hypothetical protein JWN76_761 [Chitinophagaceae bacterium]|nr:hypothetical protein [Chitinophagaceae bacterium]